MCLRIIEECVCGEGFGGGGGIDGFSPRKHHCQTVLLDNTLAATQMVCVNERGLGPRRAMVEDRKD